MKTDHERHTGRRITRTRELRGVNCPAFIHNSSYFFVNLKVYEDGVVDCWDMVDLALFEDKVRSGWVKTSVPDGEDIRIHGLGAWRVQDGEWTLPASTLPEHVSGLVRELNPEMENLHDCHGTTVRTVGKVRVAALGMGKPRPTKLQDPSSSFSRRIDGATLSVFLRCGAELFLADLRIFADGSVELGRLPTVETLEVDGLSRLADSGRLLTIPPAGSRVRIHGLGSFTAGEMVYGTALDDLLLEVKDEAKKLGGAPDSIQVCRAAYEDYCENPTEAGVERLRRAYEAIPTHNRMYVGDMDTKDVPVRMIIYGDQEIQGWSHRAVAAARGEPLPTIEVPRPSDESD